MVRGNSPLTGDRECPVELQIVDVARLIHARGTRRAGQCQLSVDLAGDALGKQSGAEQLALAGGVDAAPPVEIDLVVDDSRQEPEQLVVEDGLDSEPGIESQNVLAEYPLGGFECRLSRRPSRPRCYSYSRSRCPS